MFGRRNPDTFTPPPTPAVERPDFEILPDLPSLPAEPQAEEAPSSAADTLFASPPAPEPVAEFQTNIPPATPFVPAQPAAPAPFTATPSRPKANSESVIGPDDFFDGNYRSERGVRLQGKVHGSIESRQYILVEAGAKVEASLSAEEITVAGEFTGTIVCQQRLEISSTGYVRGNVTTGLLIVHEGGVLEGELHMKRADSAPEGD